MRSRYVSRPTEIKRTPGPEPHFENGEAGDAVEIPKPRRFAPADRKSPFFFSCLPPAHPLVVGYKSQISYHREFLARARTAVLVVVAPLIVRVPVWYAAGNRYRHYFLCAISKDPYGGQIISRQWSCPQCYNYVC